MRRWSVAPARMPKRTTATQTEVRAHSDAGTQTEAVGRSELDEILSTLTLLVQTLAARDLPHQELHPPPERRHELSGPS